MVVSIINLPRHLFTFANTASSKWIIRYIIYSYFLHFGRLPFILVMDFLCCAEVF